METCTWISSQNFSVLRSHLGLFEATGGSDVASLHTILDKVQMVGRRSVLRKM